MFDRSTKILVSTSTLFLLAAVGCTADATREAQGQSTAGAMSTTIESVYGLTSFGGSGDCQSVACGGSNSCDLQPWYSASSQRYGCNVKLQVTANGKCVVVETMDAGPASFVEADAGIAILDASPAVAQYLFGVSGGLGWSDNKDNPGKYNVNVTTTSLPLGPCDGSGGGGGGGGGGAGGSGGGGGGASSCTVGGEDGTCIDTSDCAAQGGSSTAGHCAGPANIECCTGIDSGSGGGSGGGSTGSGGSAGGASCSTDGDCNPGSEGSGQICVSGSCVDGCNADWECPGNTTCQSGQCQ
jgi:hypothetical protein